MKTEKINGIEYVTLASIKAGATIALDCARVIRQWLPIKGSSKVLGSVNTIDDWFEHMSALCIEFFAYHPVEGQYATVGPRLASIAWQELCSSMVEVRNHYNISLDSNIAIPYSNVRGGKKIKPIDSSILDRIEQASNAIQLVEEGPPLDERKESIFKMRKETKKSWPAIAAEFGGEQTKQDGEALRKEMERYAESTGRKLPDRSRKNTRR